MLGGEEMNRRIGSYYVSTNKPAFGKLLKFKKVNFYCMWQLTVELLGYRIKVNKIHKHAEKK